MNDQIAPDDDCSSVDDGFFSRVWGAHMPDEAVLGYVSRIAVDARSYGCNYSDLEKWQDLLAIHRES